MIESATSTQTVDVSIPFFREEIVKPFTSISVVCTDQGPAFLSDSWNVAESAAGTVAMATAAYSPHSNSRAERMVQTIKNALSRIIVDTTAECDELLTSIVNAIRARKANDVYRPYKLMIGIPPIRLTVALECSL